MIENLQNVLRALLDFLRTELKNRIALFLERAILALRDRPYVSFSAAQQARAAERWLATQRPALEAALHRRMLDSFSGHDVKIEPSYEELQLLDDESLNVVMLRARLVNSVMEKARESVVALEVRLEALKQAGAQINAKAFTPGAIADGFMAVLDKLAVPTEVQIVLMEAYSERGAEMLTDIYRDLNELLSNRGVMPGFKYSVVKAPAAKAKPTAPAWEGHPGGGAAGPGGGSGGPGGPGGAPGAKGGDSKAGMDFAPPWPAVSAGAALPAHFAQLLDAKLNAMQQALSQLTPENWQPGALRDTFSLPPPISLSPEQEESIDHIEAVFLDLIRDTRISARFRSEFNRLILPLMSLRLTDAELFKDPDNPVRRFIRQLALLGFRDKETPIREFEHISLVVGRIVSERAQELSSFNSGADALYTIAKNEVQRQLGARQQSRARAVAELTEQTVADSRDFVEDTLRSMSGDLQLPPAVQHFVLHLLAPRMMIEYQLHGEDSDQLRDCLLLASTFFSALEPAVSTEKQQHKSQLRWQTLEDIALLAAQTQMSESELRTLLEGVAGHFENLDSHPAGFQQRKNALLDPVIGYLDNLPLTRAH